MDNTVHRHWELKPAKRSPVLLCAAIALAVAGPGCSENKAT